MILSVWCFGVAILYNTVTAQDLPPGGLAPDGLPPGGLTYGTCVDLTFLIDVSCSVYRKEVERGIEFAKMVVDNLDSKKITEDKDTTVRIAVAIFVNKVHKLFYLNEYTTNKAKIIEELEKAKTIPEPDDIKCQTHTHLAIEALTTEYFNVTNGDRDDETFPDIAVVITDARTISRKWVTNNHLKNALDNARNAGIDIYTVLVRNEKDKEPLDIELLTGNDNSKLFNITEGNITDRIEAIRLANVLKTHACGGPPAIDLGECADIIFVLDVSCSITANDTGLSKYVASEIYMKVNAETKMYGLGTSFIVFDETAQTRFHKDMFNSVFDDIATDILDANVSTSACRTIPANMFEEVSNKELDSKESNSTKPIYMVFFYDGLTYPGRLSNKTIEKATAFKNKPDAELLLVKLWNNRDKDGSMEFDEIPTSANHLFPRDENFLNEANKNSVIEDITALIINGLKCPEEVPQ